MPLTRRTVLAGAGALAVARAVPASAALPDRAGDWTEADWAAVAAHYPVTRDIVQLENGNWGMMATPVLQAYQRHVERVNRETSYYARRGMGSDLMASRQALADHLKIDADEIVFTRNATEALAALIGRYNRLRPGDGVLIADLDYGSMQALMEDRARRSGASVTRIALPQPASRQAVLDAYAAALAANSRIRLVLLTHISHRTGLMLPIRELVAAFRVRGVDAIVDAAHGIGQADISVADLDADFVGLNVHKWIGAPLGVGALYIRRGRLDAIDPDPANEMPAPDRIESRVHTGTVDYAAQLTVPEAIAFQQVIGGPRREARLKALRDRWVLPIADLPQVEVLTPVDGSLSVGITSFRVRGETSVAENIALTKQLLDEHGIFTVHRDGIAGGACVRVTPALHNAMSDMERLASAIHQVSAMQ